MVTGVRRVAVPPLSRVIRPEIEAPIVPPALDLDELADLLAPMLDRVSYRKRFDSPAATWTWTHGLGVRPTVTATVAGEIVIPDVTYLDDNTLSIEFDGPVTGFLDVA